MTTAAAQASRCRLFVTVTKKGNEIEFDFNGDRPGDPWPREHGYLRRQSGGDLCTGVAHRSELSVQRRHVAVDHAQVRRAYGCLARVPVAGRELHAVDAPAHRPAGRGGGEVPAGEGRGPQRRQRRHARAQLADGRGGSAPLHALRDTRGGDGRLEPGRRRVRRRHQLIVQPVPRSKSRSSRTPHPCGCAASRWFPTRAAPANTAAV